MFEYFDIFVLADLVIGCFADIVIVFSRCFKDWVTRCLCDLMIVMCGDRGIG